MYGQQQNHGIYHSQGQNMIPTDAARMYMSPPSDSAIYRSQNHDFPPSNTRQAVPRIDFAMGQDPRMYASFNSGSGYQTTGNHVIFPNDSRLYSSTRNDSDSGILPVGMQQKFRSAGQSRRSRPVADPNIYASQNSEGHSSQRAFPDKPSGSVRGSARERQLYSSQNSDGSARGRAPASATDQRLYSSQSSDGSVKVASLQAAQFVQVRQLRKRISTCTDKCIKRD